MDFLLQQSAFFGKEPSADKLLAKDGKTSWAVGGKGIANFTEERGKRVRQQGKRLQPVVFPALRGKGLCGKEAFRLT